MSADQFTSSSLYVGIIRQIYPDNVTDEKAAEYFIKDYYDKLGSDELSERLKDANRKFNQAVNRRDDVGTNSFKLTIRRNFATPVFGLKEANATLE